MPKTGKASKQRSVYQKVTDFCNRKNLFAVLLALGFCLAVMNFNSRISEGHDDSLYIEAAYKFVHDFPNYYYTSNAPMYPMVLALLTLLFGTNLIIFKFFSLVFFLSGAVVFYKAVDNKIPALLKYFALMFLCINHLIVYFSSQTFSESFYLLVQATFFYFFLKFNFGERPITSDLKTEYGRWLILGLLMLLLTLAKNILVFGIAAVFFYYLVNREYRKLLFSLVSFGLWKGIYELLKHIIWGSSAIQYTSQVNILLNKDPYDASQGQEDVAGFIGRFGDNIGLYLGKRFYQMLGFIDEKSTAVSYFLAFIVLALTFYGLYRAIKDRQQVITFLILFAGTISFGTFIVLHARWDQPRLLMVHMPALLLGIAYGLYRFLEEDNFKQSIFIALLLLVSCSMFMSTSSRGIDNLPVLKRNLQGDMYYGYTPDWENFLRASAWCADSLPDTAYVASRKAPMSFVYGKGKHFFPVYSVIAKDSVTHQSDPDSALAIFKRNRVTHVIVASLRINPHYNTGDVINTVHFILAPIARKYPEKLVQVKEFGQTEPSTVYEFRY